MKIRKYITAGILTLSLVSVSYAGTITGSKTVASVTRTGTITGSRAGTITGSRVGTITGSSSPTTAAPAASFRADLAEDFLFRVFALIFNIGA
jgi:carbohydrate-binding DOMON domain-containing protein